MKRLGDLPFEFKGATCGTFIIDSLPTILLCFSWNEDKKNYRLCRSLTRTNDDVLSGINDLGFDSAFEINELPDSTYDHLGASMTNYQGFPLILGGMTNNKVEMLNTRENPPRWVEYEETDYPYLNA